MTRKARETKAWLIEQALSLVAKRLKGKEAARLGAFLRAYYRAVPPADLAGAEPAAIVGAALSHWRFAERRKPGETKIRVYNPSLDEHGWRSTHTVIEVVTDDMPFLVDSVTVELARRSLAIHLLIHPVLPVRRDAGGRLVEIAEEAGGETRAESFMHFEVDEQTAPQVLEDIRAGIARVLEDVRFAVADWPVMIERLRETMADIERRPGGLPEEEVAEAVAFLRWLEDNHFTFLGFRAYRLIGEVEDACSYELVPESGLGVLRGERLRGIVGIGTGETLPPEVVSFLRSPRILLITKANQRASVHRPVLMDTIAVKIFDSAGKVVGECRFVGLLTSTAYSRSPLDIPLLRRKVRRALARAGFASGGHDAKALEHILETYPRDELFQISDDELFEIACGILHLQERPRTKLFVRKDPYQRFVSCLVYLLRERYDTETFHRVRRILEHAFGATQSHHTVHVTDDPLARLHFILELGAGARADYDLDEIEARVAEATRSWSDRLKDALIDAFGEERGLALYHRYAEAFPVAYREDFSPAVAALDIERIEAEALPRGLALNLYARIEHGPELVSFKIYRRGGQVALSDALPVLENMGLRVIGERPYCVSPGGADGDDVWIHDFTMCKRRGGEVDVPRLKPLFHEAFARIWRREVESDAFNRLVLDAGLDWREITILRAASKYLRQTGIPFSQDYMAATLDRHGEIARLLVALFEARFDPDHQAEREAVRLAADIEERLESVASLDEDRMLRRFLNLVRSALRTNYYQPADDGAPKPYLALKLDSRALDGLPLPRPFVEIFVYAADMEGVHLRGGKVARGGIRWSDRREDYRTEILGLMKAQMVKNAVIVPVGAKGGFVLKRTGGLSREQLQRRGIAAYETLISGLLDLTDNLVKGKVVAPERVVRYDDDDPYLVVAADKGTASFSDIANAIALKRGFWLGDAFASGGQTGYDHKKMGITARGAWEAVKRHFLELGLDTQAEPFSVIGVGDMSGDVFGNGMLQSPHIRLVAAFNHRHVFIDPDPDPERSFAERKRLFESGKGGWDSYDAKVLSPGGAVFERSAKSVRLSPEARRRFGIERDKLTPNELIHALLAAEADLLWFGGIGTYVKASDESHAEVHDRANDAVRVDASELRCRVIGEGANLALTQRGRVEFALKGGKINTDAIDNSGGVDCSDHEVNIKILLDSVVAAGDLTLKQRNELLRGMEGEVADLVLRDNYLQTHAISVAEAQAPGLLESHARLMRSLERAGKLNRAVEFLPDEEEIAERAQAGGGLTRPEIAVLLAYAKMTLFSEFLEGDLPEDRSLRDDLIIYFPHTLRERFAEAIRHHRLAREIVATQIANSMVNRAGPAFAVEMEEETGADASEIARAYAAARQVFDLRAAWRSIEALDGKVPAALQLEMFIVLHRLVERGTLWFLRHAAQPIDVAEAAETYAPGTAKLADSIEAIIAPEEVEGLRTRAAAYAAKGIPEPLARRAAATEALISAPDIVDVARAVNWPVEEAGRVYFEIGQRLGFDWLRSRAAELRSRSHWQHRAVSAIVDDLYGQQRALSLAVIRVAPEGATRDGAVAQWLAANRGIVARTEDLFSDLKSSGQMDLAMLAVANRQMRALILA